MEKKNHSMKYIKQRRFLTVLPLLTLPFLTFMFWVFGGRESNNIAQSGTQQGLNLRLPDAKLKNDQLLNKLSFYQQAALDSVKTKEAEKLDPYWKNKLNDSGLGNNYNFSLSNDGMDANQMKVYNKLDELKKALSTSQNVSTNSQSSGYHPYSMQSYASSNDADRLQSMMQKMNQDKTEDPEITQLNNMLDKIQAIQNPDQMKTNDKTSAGKKLTVKPTNSRADISLLKPGTNKSYYADTNVADYSKNVFYTTSSFDAISDSNFSNAIEATIPETQTFVAGSTIKLALGKDVTIQNVVLPSGMFIYGTTSLSNERLKIDISSIRFQNSILPVTLSVYDMDGQEGIYIPGSINRTVAKESANNAIGGMDVTTLDPSIGVQAASAGIQTAKTLLSKKVRLIKMTVNAGYKVLLKDNHDN